MQEAETALYTSAARRDWLRLRTFIMLRWIAIVGQIGAIAVARIYYDLQLESGMIYAAIAASIIANLVSIAVFPETKRLSEKQAMALLLFDISQLALLVFLTGGLHNPFTLLIVVPVTISATALGTRSTVLLGLVAVMAATLLANFHIPLRTEQGAILQMPQVFVFGFWVAIVICVVFLATYTRRVTSEIHSMSEALLATQMALSREQKLTDLGGVVAAAAHELGTPLATIKLVSTELIEELNDNETLREDAALIRTQADRCRDILHAMGRNGKDDLHLKTAPLSAVVTEAAEPHMNRGKTVLLDIAPDSSGGAEPVVLRQPEVVHGMRNLIQNAVDFARETIWVEVRWNAAEIQLRVMDDGPGYPPQLIGRLGDPYMRHRRSTSEQRDRPEYEGMGLGLFIAKTLLERSGAELSFANGTDPFLTSEERPERCGAIVSVKWARGGSGLDQSGARAPLGKNQPIRT